MPAAGGLRQLRRSSFACERAAHLCATLVPHRSLFDGHTRPQRFFCWGRCMVGPNWRSCIGSVLLLLVPTVVFLVWVAYYMGQKVSWAIFAVR